MLLASLRSAALPLVAALVLLAPAGASAQATAQSAAPSAAQIAEVGPLIDALGINELLPIMREEGLSYANELASDMFPGRGGDRWEELADRIYDVDRMTDVMTREMAGDFDEGEIDPLLDFFTSELGRRIVRLEVSAREALLEASVEEASEAALADMRANEDPRLDVLQGFVEANDLIESNVVGALNSNWAFYQGLDAGGAFDGVLTEEEMLADVWGQEEDIRTDTTEWVFSYLALAYQPLSDEEIGAYTGLSMTPAGATLNASLFAAFDTMFTMISRDLGLAAATFMAGEDI
ncbi:MAG: DUF2059 domain-containing protein [Pseudomonadota bacterium]